MVVCADYFTDQELQHIEDEVDEELRMFLGRVPKTASSLNLWFPILTLSSVCVSNCIFFKLGNLAFGKDALDQAFSRSAKKNTTK